MRALPTISGASSVLAHGAGQLGRHLADRAVGAAADVERAARRLRQDERVGEGAGDVRHMDEVAPLLAVLEDHRRLAVQQPRGEDGEHAGVRVRQRLAGAIDVEQAQAHALDAIGRGHDVRRPLLDELVERVDRRQRRPLPFGRGDGRQRPAAGVDRLPVGQPVAQRAARGILDQRAVGVAVQALAVDAHRAGGDDAAHRRVDQRLEQRRRADVVGRGIAYDLVHRLADPDLGGEVDDAVDAAQRARSPPPCREHRRGSARLRATSSVAPSVTPWTWSISASRTRTRLPRRSSSSATKRPMKPAPPVINTVSTRPRYRYADRTVCVASLITDILMTVPIGKASSSSRFPRVVAEAVSSARGTDRRLAGSQLLC